LQQRDELRPFFMHLSFQRPHNPLTVPHDRGLLYDPETIRFLGLLARFNVSYFTTLFKRKFGMAKRRRLRANIGRESLQTPTRW
jgi:hypothetical protein